MTTRIILIALTSAAVVAGAAGCSKSSGPTPAPTPTSSINPMPTDPNAPVNHFHVIQPQNQIPGLGYAAYWFGPGQSVNVVKNGLLLNFQVQDNPGSPRARSVDELKADDIKLADQIVPRVG